MSIHVPLAVPELETATMTAPTPRLWLPVLIAWAGISALMLIVSWSHIAQLTMWDPDDYMRLAQFRDWIGGQGFFDVSQYRFDPPHGFAMHWSRLVDLPLAAITLLLSPLIGPVMGERVAVTIIPLLTLGGIMAGVALATVRLASSRAALIAAAIAATTPLVLFYVLPLRIDHHGWQVMMAALTLAACFDSNPRRGGAMAGFAAATWLTVSMEGLPAVTAIAMLHGLRFVIEGRRFESYRRCQAFLLSLGLIAIFWLVALRGPFAWGRSYGDMLSPAWLGPLSLAPLIGACFAPIIVDRGLVARLGLMVAAAAFGVGALLWIDAGVLSGPFKTLDPMVRTYWYNNVSEGLPIWKQPGDTVMLLATFPLVGIAGMLLAWCTAHDDVSRRNWLALLFIASSAFAVSLFVQRAGAVSHIYMTPGAAALLVALLAKADAVRKPLVRVSASVGAILLCSPLMTASAGMAVIALTQPPAPPTAAASPACEGTCDAFGALNRLPPSYILATLDVGPLMLINTPHSFLGSGYHRNVGAIHGIISSFTQPADTAHRLMAARGMRYLLIDPDGNEATIYSQHAPGGLMAKLLNGQAPAWLEPVPLPHSRYRMWRRTG